MDIINVYILWTCTNFEVPINISICHILSCLLCLCNTCHECKVRNWITTDLTKQQLGLARMTSDPNWTFGSISGFYLNALYGARISEMIKWWVWEWRKSAINKMEKFVAGVLIRNLILELEIAVSDGIDCNRCSPSST